MIFNNELVQTASNELESFKEYLKVLFIQNRHLMKIGSQETKEDVELSFYTLTDKFKYENKKNGNENTTSVSSKSENDSGVDCSSAQEQENGATTVCHLNGDDDIDAEKAYDGCKTCSHCLALRLFLGVDLKKTSYMEFYNKIGPLITTKYSDLNHLISKKYGNLIKLKENEIKQAIYEWDKYRLTLNYFLITNSLHIDYNKTYNNPATSSSTAADTFALDENHVNLFNKLTKSYADEYASESSLNFTYVSERLALCDMQMNYEFESDIVKHKFLYYILKKWSKDDSLLNFNNYLHYGIPRARIRKIDLESVLQYDNSEYDVRVSSSKHDNQYQTLSDLESEFDSNLDELTGDPQIDYDLQMIDDKYEYFSSSSEKKKSVSPSLSRASSSSSSTTASSSSSSPSSSPMNQKKQVNAVETMLKRQPVPPKRYYVYRRVQPPSTASSQSTSRIKHQQRLKSNAKRALMMKNKKKINKPVSSSLLMNGSLGTSSLQSSIAALSDIHGSIVNINISDQLKPIRGIKRIANGLFERTLKRHFDQRKQLKQIELQNIQKSLTKINQRKDLNVVQGGIVTNTNIYYPLNIRKKKCYYD